MLARKEPTSLVCQYLKRGQKLLSEELGAARFEKACLVGRWPCSILRPTVLRCLNMRESLQAPLL